MAATAELARMAVYDGTMNDVLALREASEVSYRLAVQPLDRSAPAMVSLWMKAEADMTVGVNALGKGFVLAATPAWQRFELAVENPVDGGVVVSPVGNGALYLYECMAEARATRASDWVPAPEDVDEDIEEASDRLRDEIGGVQRAAEAAMATIRSLAVGGVNLIDGSEAITIVGTDDPDTSFRLLAEGLEADRVYTLSMASATLVSGSAAGMTLELLRQPPDGAAPVRVTETTLDFSGGHQKYTFATGAEDTYLLRLYAGLRGSGNGVTVQVSKAKLETGTFATMWTASQADAEARLVALTSRLIQDDASLSFVVEHLTEDAVNALADIDAWFRFDGSDPNDPKLMIGTTESDMEMTLSNSRLSFSMNGMEVAYFSDNKLYVTNVEAVERMSIGTAQNGCLEMVTTDTGVGFMWRAG